MSNETAKAATTAIVASYRSTIRTVKILYHTAAFVSHDSIYDEA